MRKVIGIGETILDIIFKNDQPHTARAGRISLQRISVAGASGSPGFFHQRSRQRPCR